MPIARGDAGVAGPVRAGRRRRPGRPPRARRSSRCSAPVRPAGPVWEACDRYGLVGTWLPEWNRLRGLPQHHPIHVYTVDRHCVQAVVEAHAYIRDVSRPDLLLVAALLHDVGKGLPGDHSEAGAPIAARDRGRDRLPAADVATDRDRWYGCTCCCRTSRPAGTSTTRSRSTGVADAVGDVATLDLLHALCRADATAAGPSATSPWKTRLIGELAGHVRALLADGTLPGDPYADRAVAGAATAGRRGHRRPR